MVSSMCAQAVYQRMASDAAAWWSEDVVDAELLNMPLLLPGARMLHAHAAATALTAAMA